MRGTILSSVFGLWLTIAIVFALLTTALALTSCGDSTSGGNAQGSETPDEMAITSQSSEGMQGMNMETVDSSTAGVHVDFSSDPAESQPGQSVALHYLITYAGSSQVLTDLPIVHERPMHLIAVSKDLSQFQHIHPEVDANGTYTVTATFPRAGTEILFDEFAPNGQMVLDRRELPVGKTSETGASLSPDLSPKTEDGLTASLLAPEAIEAGEDERFTLQVTRDGQPVTDLEPYLGAAAHVAIISSDTRDFAHTHGEASEADKGHEGMESMGSSSSTFGPEVSFHHTFPHAGLYKLWIQFGYQGSVITVPYVVEVR
jgi:hypothetical protein